jgi:hypothetical protein
MALGTQKISAFAAPGMAAAATAHPFSGGRGVAAANQSPVEASNFSASVNVNDNGILHYDDESGLNPDDQGRGSYNPRGTQTPFMARRALAYSAISLDSHQGDNAPTTVFSDLMSRGIRGYERSQSLVQTHLAPVGSTINQLN